jgi:phenylacetate-CoA ligase
MVVGYTQGRYRHVARHHGALDPRRWRRCGMIMHNAYGYSLFIGGLGEKGELVFTSLTKEAFPIVRYRTRDLTRLLPGTARPGMRRMEKVTGHSDDMIILRGVNLFPTQIEEVLLATDWCGGHFVIELTRQGRMDEMTVHAEARREHWDGSGLMDHAEKVTVYIKNTIGITTQIRIVAPETLERSLGKAKRVVDKRPKG